MHAKILEVAVEVVAEVVVMGRATVEKHATAVRAIAVHVQILEEVVAEAEEPEEVVVMERVTVEKHVTAVRVIAVYAHLLLPHHHPPVEMAPAIVEKPARVVRVTVAHAPIVVEMERLEQVRDVRLMPNAE